MKNLPFILVLLFVVACQKNKTETIQENSNDIKELSQKIQNQQATDHYIKGVTLFNQNDFDNAKTFFKKSLEIEKNTITLNKLGSIALVEKNNKEALSYFNQGIKQDFNYWPNHINKSRVFISQSHYSSAHNTLKNMLSKCKSNYWKANAHLFLAHIYLDGVLDCKNANASAQKASLLKNDPKLKNHYRIMLSKMNEYCNQIE